MEQQNHSENQTLDSNTDEEIEQLQNLDEEVKLMAQKIADFRQTLPDQLKDTLASIISAQRPVNLTFLDGDSDPGPSDVITCPDSEDPEHTEKLEMIKQKISDNASAMPLLVKRMKACISRIDQLDSFKQDMIHPAFTRKWST
ncbi:uncharacterized protein LOC110900383 isoform X1 [Helianthus annuus]|uniref:Uncharacterized protein n=1 Tax=Helianthus annuus TaxID=4232 RepID=A0A251SXT8_HELAN|nr:uncharacterized protein LOC110900383 isoform X1 [Helianthus annuus]